MARKLKAPPECEEASVGATRYVVRDGEVSVENDTDAAALKAAGFVEAPAIPEPPEVPDGLVTLQHADDGASCSWGGVTYEPDSKGFVKVPAAAVADLAAFGFTPASATQQPALTTTQAAPLTETQVAALTATQLRALDTTEIGALDATEIAAIEQPVPEPVPEPQPEPKPAPKAPPGS